MNEKSFSSELKFMVEHKIVKNLFRNASSFMHSCFDVEVYFANERCIKIFF